MHIIMHMTDENRNLIIGFVPDLIFQVKIETAAERQNFEVRWLSAPELPGSEAVRADPARLGEEVEGPGAVLLDQISRLHPALILFDLNSAEVPWKAWIALLKTSPATRRIPLICFGSHVHAEALTAAMEAGAQAALPRSRFSAEVEALIQEYARVSDNPAIEAACAEELSPTARRGLELFNHGEYFEAHELLEAAWNQEPAPGKELYRAILQVAVAYLQIERRNYNGAVKMFWRTRQWIDPLPDECRGVDIARLRQDAQAVYTALVGLGKEKIGSFDRSLLKPVRYRQENSPKETG